MNILFCGYRDWSLRVLDDVKRWSSNTNFTLVCNKDEFNKVKHNDYDITILVGWSWIIPDKYIEQNFTVVIHPSDLPKYTGGSPIQNQIIDGLTETKLTLFKATTELDNGPIIDQYPLSLLGSMDDILADICRGSFALLNIFIENFPNHIEKPQTGTIMKRKRRTPEMSEITIEDLQQCSALELHNKIRCLQDPYPNAFIKTQLGKLYITETTYEDDNIPPC